MDGQLFVDGRNVQMTDFSYSLPGKWTWKREGFTVETERIEETGKFFDITRVFRFQRVKTSTNETPDNTIASLATIELRICRVEEGEKTFKVAKSMNQDLPKNMS